MQLRDRNTLNGPGEILVFIHKAASNLQVPTHTITCDVPIYWMFLKDLYIFIFLIHYMHTIASKVNINRFRPPDCVSFFKEHVESICINRVGGGLRTSGIRTFVRGFDSKTTRKSVFFSAIEQDVVVKP